MHTIAKHLGVSATALYRHIPSKQALIELCTDTISEKVSLPITMKWEPFLYELAREYRRVALSMPGSVEFIRYVGLQTPEALKVVEHSLGVMRQAGFNPEAAFMSVAGVISHATDMVLHEEQDLKKREALMKENASPPNLPEVLAPFPNTLWALGDNFMIDHEHNFETGLKIIIEGIKSVYDMK
ncbi:TetR/AcrR family transcriptional regulator C-terminal domain-containing protein [Pseudovibrio denitrificans]|nr:TetR/AcrR family transcriptional regulator C-terminal domain-containing protein [Pseudovibrio denitrificans]